MRTITVSNVNQALRDGLYWLKHSGVRSDSRNGPVIVSPCPVATTYLKPVHRVLFSPLRDANPFFHLMEALWMLGGRQDLEWPRTFNKRFAEYSDDGKRVWGAYGYRWRRWFGYDQLDMLINELKANPTTRRAVLAMWDGDKDLAWAIGGGVDVPCNTHAYFSVASGFMDMTVCCRSNDILWGAYGANAVHFSILLEYMAAAVGVKVGNYIQFSNNYHLYEGVLSCSMDELINDLETTNYYCSTGVPTTRLINTDRETWDRDLRAFLEDPFKQDYADDFFNLIALRMYAAWVERKRGGNDTAMEIIDRMPECDWKLACQQWIQRRTPRAGAAK